MKSMNKHFLKIVILLLLISVSSLFAQDKETNKAIDDSVTKFLSEHRNSWRDLNVPDSDGQLLHDIIVENGYTRALEIGTSTGHSGIWIAWALSKTGGKLITLEIDESRHKEALGHFEEAGLSEYVDARLGDAHTIVPELEETFDFVFSDADKDWYTNYFKAAAPKLEIGGCYTTHNISERGQRGRGRNQGTQNGGYIDYVRSQSNFETTIDSSGSGLMISYKKSE
ncbi:O-methyltransferase [Candidatus Latescibacterota bacterium]